MTPLLLSEQRSWLQVKQEVRHFERKADLGAIMLLVGTVYVNEAAYNEEELQQMQEQGREPQVLTVEMQMPAKAAFMLGHHPFTPERLLLISACFAIPLVSISEQQS